MIVIKVSGHVLQDSRLRIEFAEWVSHLAQTVVVVHGGGSELDDIQQKLGIPIQKRDGLRITDEPTLDAALMVLSGLTNKRLVSSLITAGVDAIGLSGVDAALIRVKKIEDPNTDYGFVGVVDHIRGELLDDLIKKRLSLVISPLAIGSDGQIFNVNADQVASAVAARLHAEQLIFLSDVSGVHVDGELLGRLCSSQIESYIQERKITDGMIPKVLSGLKALDQGVAMVRIANMKSVRSSGGTQLFRHNPI
ncbi:MAG: acetylglutamate kinase [Anaerolineales bacterium]|nr:acetylglutamate kinase [Anaerolineales bacterium]